MARMQDEQFTYLSDREIAGTGLGTSPAAVAAYSDLQRAVFEASPADTQAAQDAAEAAGKAASGAQETAELAQGSADAALMRADDAYDLAETKVTKEVGPVFAAPAAVPSRSALPAYSGDNAGAIYSQSDMQDLIDQVEALTSRVAALIVDLRANGSLTS
jgi:hypothetical protein